MKIIYLQCNMGVSGDMLIGALSDLFDDKKEIENKLNSLGLLNTQIILENETKSSVCATKARVFVNSKEEGSEQTHNHSHMTLLDVSKIIDSLNVSDKVKQDAKQIYNSIALAESKVHNTQVGAVHFHELGAMDAIADVVCASYLFELINADKVYVSPINAGSGNVKCAHGILPVPAPATAVLLENIPFYISDIPSELCTPTGIAIIRHFATDFKSPNVIVNEKVGYGLGSKTFEQLNCLRVFLAHTDSQDEVVELSCNIDDMTGEELAFACEELLNNGALDVYTMPIGMKKSRQGVKLSVICEKADSDKFARLIFLNTSTIGIRQCEHKRYVLDRKQSVVSTPFGDVRIKESSGWGVSKIKAESDDLIRLARQNDLTLNQVKKIVEECL